MSNTIAGGWSGFSFEIKDAESNVFNTALLGFMGVKYIPLAVATQVVAGTNYCFLCKGITSDLHATEIVTKVHIYQPLEGDAHISEIIRINP
jgi:hypothetical protein